MSKLVAPFSWAAYLNATIVRAPTPATIGPTPPLEPQKRLGWLSVIRCASPRRENLDSRLPQIILKPSWF